MYRLGTGYDIHRLTEGRKLLLGGVEIPFEKGLAGHSDADVLLHALCDALLGASGLGDIGTHFPDTDPAFKGIPSSQLLARTWSKVGQAGFEIVNIDTIIFAEKPKIGPYRQAIGKKIAQILSLSPGRINIKAKTMEGLGEIGKGEGIGAMCVVLLKAAGFSQPKGKEYDHQNL